MKHLMLFENFDRYDFKVYTDDLNLNFNEMYSASVGFNDKELDELKAVYPKMKVISFNNRRYVQMCGGNHYIYALGDYCYCVATVRNISVVGLNIIDGIEEVISVMDDYINDLSINESFDRYEFQTRTDVDMDDFDKMATESIPFKSEDYEAIIDLIKNVDGVLISKKYEDYKPVIVFRYKDIAVYIIHYFGDYCFSITTQDWDTAEILEISTNDDIDDLIDELKNKLKI